MLSELEQNQAGPSALHEGATLGEELHGDGDGDGTGWGPNGWKDIYERDESSAAPFINPRPLLSSL